MKYLVCATIRERAIKYLEELIGEMKYKEIKKIRKSQGDMLVELRNGDTYRVISASDNSRGYKCHKVYVEKFVDKEIIDNVIRPLCILDSSDKEPIIYFD